MPKRICPKCNSVLGSFDHYFCSACGNSLEGDVVQPVAFTRTTYFTVPSNSRTEFLNKAVEVVRGKVELLVSSKNLVMGLSALLLLVLAVGVIYYLVNLNFMAKVKIICQPVEPLDSNLHIIYNYYTVNKHKTFINT